MSLSLADSPRSVVFLHKWTYYYPYMERRRITALERPPAGFSAERAVDLSSRDAQERLSRAAIPAFFKLARAWEFA